jgi:hypothetical protein
MPGRATGGLVVSIRAGVPGLRRKNGENAEPRPWPAPRTRVGELTPIRQRCCNCVQPTQSHRRVPLPDRCWTSDGSVTSVGMAAEGNEIGETTNARVREHDLIKLWPSQLRRDRRHVA